jgi:hypothetical protein
LPGSGRSDRRNRATMLMIYIYIYIFIYIWASLIYICQWAGEPGTAARPYIDVHYRARQTYIQVDSDSTTVTVSRHGATDSDPPRRFKFHWHHCDCGQARIATGIEFTVSSSRSHSFICVVKLPRPQATTEFRVSA